ncbi:MAG: hypothetical protein ACYTFT_16110, partial [Planctomycetota bacterium]
EAIRLYGEAAKELRVATDESRFMGEAQRKREAVRTAKQTMQSALERARRAQADRFASTDMTRARQLESDAQSHEQRAECVLMVPPVAEAARPSVLTALDQSKLGFDAAQRAYTEAEQAAGRGLARQRLLEQLDEVLLRASGHRASYTQMVASAKARKAKTDAAEAKAAEAEQMLRQAESQAARARQPGTSESAINDTKNKADRAGSLFQAATLLAQNAPTPTTTTGGGSAAGPLGAIQYRVKKFDQAMEGKNIEALKKCFMAMPSNMEKGYGSLFRRGSVKIEVVPDAPKLVSDDEAHVHFDMVIVEGTNRGNPTRAKLILVPSGPTWKIAELTK